MIHAFLDLWDADKGISCGIMIDSFATIDDAIIEFNGGGYAPLTDRDRITLIPKDRDKDCTILRPDNGQWIVHIPCHNCRFEIATYRAVSRFGASYRYCSKCIEIPGRFDDKKVWTIKPL
jgi:hypothetical protein